MIGLVVLCSSYIRYCCLTFLALFSSTGSTAYSVKPDIHVRKVVLSLFSVAIFLLLFILLHPESEVVNEGEKCVYCSGHMIDYYETCYIFICNFILICNMILDLQSIEKVE